MHHDQLQIETGGVQALYQTPVELNKKSQGRTPWCDDDNELKGAHQIILWRFGLQKGAGGVPPKYAIFFSAKIWSIGGGGCPSCRPNPQGWLPTIAFIFFLSSQKIASFRQTIPYPMLSATLVLVLCSLFCKLCPCSGISWEQCSSRRMMGGGAQSCWRDDKWDWAAEYADQSCAITRSSWLVLVNRAPVSCSTF